MTKDSSNSEFTSSKPIYINTKNSENSSAPKEITIEQRQKLESLRDFLWTDDQIKKSLISGAPPYYTESEYQDSLAYEKKFNNSFNEVSSLFTILSEKMSNLGLPGDDILKKSKTISNNVLQSPQWDFDKLSESYEKYFESIKPNLGKEIYGKIIGYYMFKDSSFHDILEKVTSFNELLLLAHSYVSSDENLFSQLPRWDTTKEKGDNSDWHGYNAYGEKNENAAKIFNYLKEQLQANNFSKDEKEIPSLLQLVSIGNSIQLIVRDFGHALSIKIDTSEPRSALVKYSVPKIWDGKMVNQLPGIEKIQPITNKPIGASVGANGKFELPYENLAKDIFDFILKVPTDHNH